MKAVEKQRKPLYVDCTYTLVDNELKRKARTGRDRKKKEYESARHSFLFPIQTPSREFVSRSVTSKERNAFEDAATP